METKKTFLDNGKLKKVNHNEKPDYYFQSGADFLSTATNLIPGVGGVSGGRVLLGDKASVQAISLINRESPLIQSSPGKGASSFEQFLGKNLVSLSAPIAGQVTKIQDNFIHLKNKDGAVSKVEMYNNFNSGKKSFLHHTPAVNVGDEVKKGQLIATSNFSDNKGNLALGVNLQTAIMPYRSNNFEDAFVVTESGAKKLTAEQLVTVRLDRRLGVDTKKDMYISLFANKFYNDQLAAMDSDGVVKKGTILKHGDPVILAYSPKALKTTDIHLGKLSKALGNAYKDLTETWHYESEGEVTDVAKSGTLLSVNIKLKRNLNVGDKLSIYSGNKGVTGLILPDHLAPTTTDGRAVDLVLNSMSVTSRVSPAMLSNLGMGKVAQKLGKQLKITGFVEGSSIKQTQALMKQHGVKDVEELFDPISGTKINALVGPLFINRLVHIAEDKISDRAQGIGYDWDMQPTKARDESAKRLGNLSTSALLSHGATEVLKDIAVVRATKNDVFWRNLKQGMPAPAPEVPFIFNKFVASLEGAGIKVDRKNDVFQILPQTDEDITKMSSGAISNAKTFKVKGQNLIPEKGGLFDPVNTGIFGQNFNHVDLNFSIPNPISEDPLRRLLKMTKEQYETNVANGTVQTALRNLNIDKQIEEYKTYLRTGKISERANAVKVLSFLNMLKKAGKHPKDLILSKLPILPAHYRPVQVAGDLTLSANVNHLYKDLILNNDKLKDTQYVPDEVVDEAKRAHYNAVKAVYGLGDPISIKNKEKQIKGLLAEMLGTHGGTAKTSVFQAKVVNKPLDLISRSVATGDVKLGLDEISLPQDIVWKIYSPFVIRRMVRKGTPVTQAHEYVKTKNPLAIQSLLEEMDDRPVTMSRDPALHKFNLMGFTPKINPDPANKTVSVNPLVFKGFNLDLDGDQISVGVPASDQAKEEIKDKMLPSKNLLTVRGFSPLYTPSNEAALGMYQMSTVSENNKPIHFDNAQQVLDAYNQAKVNVGTQIIVKNDN